MSTNFHLACYSSSVPNGTALTAVNAVNDQVLTIQDNKFILPGQGKLLQVASLSLNMQRVRLNTPSARYVSLPYMAPVNVGATVPSYPQIADFGFGPLTIPKADMISMEATHAGAGAQNVYIAAWFGFLYRDAQPGQRYRVRATGTITNSAGTWQSGSLNMEQTLPAGMYAVVGLDVIGANLFAARLIFPGSSYRPGVLCRESLGNTPSDVFTNGKLGTYGVFDSVNTPNLETLSVGANTSQEVYMDLVKISG